MRKKSGVQWTCVKSQRFSAVWSVYNFNFADACKQKISKQKIFLFLCVFRRVLPCVPPRAAAYCRALRVFVGVLPCVPPRTAACSAGVPPRTAAYCRVFCRALRVFCRRTAACTTAYCRVFRRVLPRVLPRATCVRRRTASCSAGVLPYHTFFQKHTV